MSHNDDGSGRPAAAFDERILPGEPAIAVLPFKNLSGGPDQEVFVDAIAEDLITRLSLWRHFPVIARNSSFVYKGEEVDVQRVSRELNARYVIEGSVQRVGNRVRITAQLVDAAARHQLWAERYERELGDVFTLQDELSTAVVAAIHPELELAEWKRIRLREPGSLSAWEAVIRGRSCLLSVDRDNARAREFFERAIELDPYLVAGFWGLAMSHWNHLLDMTTDDPEHSSAEIVRAAERCIALDDQNALGHLALAAACQVAGRLAEFIEAAETAVRLNPSESRAYQWLGWGLGQNKQFEEAIACLEQGERLNPRDRWNFCYTKAIVHFVAERYEDAIAEAKRSLQHRPGTTVALQVLTASLAQLGHLDEARAALQDLLRLTPGLSLSNALAAVPASDPDYRALSGGPA